jgi:DNA-binding CsgD family transcriptional regulator
MVLLSGEAGSGKSTVVQHFVDGIEGARVLWGACDPLATPRPLGPFHDMAGAWSEAAARHLREAQQSHEIFAAIHAELREQPSVLVVEDLHWADQGTVDLLRYLLRRVDATVSLVIGTMRDDELGVDHPLRSLLGDAARSAHAESITLAALTAEGIAALAGARQIDAASLRDRTGGNAFFVTELLDHQGDELPATVRDAVLARTVGLPDDAWDLLHLLACAPEAIPDPLLVPLGIGVAPLRSLHDRGLIRRGPRGVMFRHDLTRLAIASTVTPGTEPLLHRRLLDALEASPAPDAAVLVHHAIGAGDAAAILRHAAAAGRTAARSGAHTQAAEFYERALERAVAAPAAERAALWEAVALEYYLTDRLDDAIAASARAMRVRDEAGDVVGVATNHHSLAVYHWYNAERDKADEHARAAVAVLDGHETAGGWDRAARGHGYAMQAFLALHASRLRDARENVVRARDESTATDEPTIHVRVDLADGLIGLTEGQPSGRARVLGVLEGAGDDYDNVYSAGYSHLGSLDVEQRRFAEAADVLSVSITRSIERDLPICRVWQTGVRGRLKLLTGDWDGALSDADDVLSGQSAPLARLWPYLERAVIGLRRFGECGDDLDAAWALAHRYGERLKVLQAAAVVAERAWITGDDDPRLDECRALLADPPVAGQEWSRGELALWLHRRDTGTARMTVAGVAEPYARELDGDAAGAAKAWEAIGAPFEQAMALAQAQDDDSARRALEMLDRLGADAVAAKVRAALRAEGIVSVPARRRAATLANAAGLTARQQEVLRQMSRGLTNAELADALYISAKTVDHHVSEILTKLGVASRREAVRAAREMGLLD